MAAEEHVLTERAQNVLFFAKYYSSPDKPRPVEPEHILLAIVVLDPKLFLLLLATESDQVITALRDDLKAFDPTVHQSWLAAEPPPLSSAAEQVISLAAEERDRLGHTRTGTEHLLLGLIRSQSSVPGGKSSPSPVSEILMKRGFTFERVATQVKKGSLTPQSDDPDRSPVVRALPASSRRPPPRSLFRSIREACHRFRILFAILLTIGCASPARFLELSGTNHRASIDRSKRAKPITYLALGDSTGLGLGAKNGHGYVEQLMAQIQNEHPGSRLAKLCRLGETTTGLRQRLTEGFPVKPTFASLSIGINDLLNRVSEEQFAANYEEIVRSLTRLGVPIVVTNLPDVSSTPRLPKSMREEVRVKLILFNKLIESLAKRYDLLFVDVYAATAKLLTKHQEFFAADGFHPSDAGYKLWAQTMWPKVKMAIKRSLISPRLTRTLAPAQQRCIPFKIIKV